MHVGTFLFLKFGYHGDLAETGLWERACPAMPVRTASCVAWSGLIAGQARSQNRAPVRSS
ncbi:hypothetical protein C1X75_07760 [Pseudomonas sp. FW305-17]|nr:hypothetical protein C1X75_07760 [Pseudomonas sp. FW305-17]